MQFLAPYVVPLTLLFAVGGIFFVVAAIHFDRRGKRSKKTGAGALDLPCPTCQRTLVVHRNDLQTLSAQETALMVSATREEFGGKLGAYRCPYCDAEHTFAIEGRTLRLVATDTFTPHGSGTHCTNCNEELIRPTWARGAYDGNVEEAPDLQPRHGLVCSRCDAICCFKCCKDITRNRTTDGSQLCPRCFRGPVNQFYHW